MCIGKPKTPEVKQPDPTPMAVSKGEVQAEGADSAANAQQRKKRGYAYNKLSNDRDTIIGAAGGKQTLG